jgi:hypothetical protein
VAEQVAAGDEGPQLGIGDAPRQHPEPAIGVDEDDPLGPQAAGRALNPPGHLVRRLDLVVLDVDHPDPGTEPRLDLAEHLQLGLGPAGHLQDDMVGLQGVQEGDEFRVGPPLDRLPAVVPEAEVDRPPARGDPLEHPVDPAAAIGPSSG